ncbi:unnamed protein product [Effrenium voratum]|uniref:Uncharacterized protein n=1 Tax=Effrenium voratum TaxID=2562239 RepID=A0AA36NCA2_9DINO|nr:unnamed protein product [Effrenium voratum]
MTACPDEIRSAWGKRLQLGSEILEATFIDASNLPWRVILAGPASAEAASGAAVRLLRSNADGTWALEPKSAAWEAMLQALPSHLILTELCAEGWAQRQLLFDATRNRSARLAVDWAFPPYVAYTGNRLRSAPVRSFSATARLSLKAELAGKDLYLQGLSFLNALDFGPWLLRSDDASGAFAADGREELEWLLAKVCAFNATAELQVAAALLEAPSATSEVWLTAQRRNWLPRAAREAIANEGCVGDFCSPQGFYRMEGIGTTQLEGSRAWPMSQQVSFHGSSEAAVLTNPWRNQALRFELRVLPAFDKQRAMQLLPQQLSSFEYNQTELSIQAEGDFSFRFRQMSMASFGKASWTLPSPVDMSQETCWSRALQVYFASLT